ncbi:MAG: hypothetical protein F6K65_37300 [Moorea sp. SIO3C2]|nr:hypothetical protein [Moorena sp. SIO3C2]
MDYEEAIAALKKLEVNGKDEILQAVLAEMDKAKGGQNAAEASVAAQAQKFAGLKTELEKLGITGDGYEAITSSIQKRLQASEKQVRQRNVEAQALESKIQENLQKLEAMQKEVENQKWEATLSKVAAASGANLKVLEALAKGYEFKIENDSALVRQAGTSEKFTDIKKFAESNGEWKPFLLSLFPESVITAPKLPTGGAGNASESTGTMAEAEIALKSVLSQYSPPSAFLKKSN